MDPNQLAGRNPAEPMLVLSALILVAVAMLIVSHWRGTRRRAHRPARIEMTVAPGGEEVLVAPKVAATAAERA